MNDLLEAAISELQSKKLEVILEKRLSSGKEATVYLVSIADRLMALKVYKDSSQRSFKNNQEYLAGKYIHSPSQRKAMQQRNRFGKELMHKLWVKREFYMLKKLYDLGVKIPQPIEMTSNSILMEYLGTRDFPAPKMKDIKLSREELEIVYKQVLDDIDLMFENGIVHGDLSPFNILYWQDKPFIIDFPQSVDVRNNPNAQAILERDIKNITNWYEKNKSLL